MALPDQGMFDLGGKVVLVTGAAQGLGKAVAEACAQQGAVVIIVDVEDQLAQQVASEIQQATGQSVTAHCCDVRCTDQVQELVATVITQHDRIDVLVNNAGIHRRVDPLDISAADVQAIFDVNLVGCLNMASAVGKVMIQQQAGSIINVSALGGGVIGLGRGGSVYGMTKGGLISLTRDLAAEWGRHGIRVNALAPGWIETPMTQALQNDRERSTKVVERVPLGRWGKPQDVAGTAIFLASDASRYITGHTIPIDGGAANVIALDQD